MHEYRSEVAATTDRQAGGGDVDHSALIASALTNLLTNAFKFSHAKGPRMAPHIGDEGPRDVRG